MACEHPLHPTALRPWQPLSDDEWAALNPYLLPSGGCGRPTDKRRILNAVFWISCYREPWPDARLTTVTNDNFLRAGDGVCTMTLDRARIRRTLRVHMLCRPPMRWAIGDRHDSRLA